MRKPFAFLLAFLLVAPLFMAVAAGTASAKDLYTIPINQSVQVSPNIKANLIELEISDVTKGGSYAENPDAVIYPILWYTFQNVGSVPESGHLHVKLIDDQGEVYEGTDPGTMELVQPGKTTAPRPIEINIPKDRKITQLVVVMGFNEQNFPISYGGSTTSTPTKAPSGSATGTPGGFCLGSLILPLTIVGLAWAGVRLAKK